VCSAPRVLGIIAAAALTCGLAACSSTGQSVQPAAVRSLSAAVVQVRVQPDVTGWSGMVQRPHVIYVGMGGAPVARRLAWRHWGSRTAWANGKLDIYWPQPGPISGWHPATYTVTVRLQDIQTHNGQPYYRNMAYVYVNRRGIAKSLQFRFSVQPGGSAPSWNPTRPGTAGGRSGQSTSAIRATRYLPIIPVPKGDDVTSLITHDVVIGQRGSHFRRAHFLSSTSRSQYSLRTAGTEPNAAAKCSASGISVFIVG
jgi:hypothetical protein